MSEQSIETPRLRLVPNTREAVLAHIERMDADQRKEISPDWLERVRVAPDPWTLGFAVVDPGTRATVGTCGFKGPPDATGMVEIAYGINADQQGKGYATEVADALVAYAFTDTQVRFVRAHTLSDTNASARVLTKCGFRPVGRVLDPEDGVVWRWERRDPGRSPGTAETH